ncbi:MAG TPA: hypothetical protein VNM48_01510 [Chloroflexota bacterium]|nr:hypothetical protein [Chloroflexota bacterium]
MTAPRDIRFMGAGFYSDATKEGAGRRHEPIPVDATLQETILAALPELAERTRAQLLDLVREPTVARCDSMLRELAEVSTQVRRLGSALSQSPTV